MLRASRRKAASRGRPPRELVRERRADDLFVRRTRDSSRRPAAVGRLVQRRRRIRRAGEARASASVPSELVLHRPVRTSLYVRTRLCSVRRKYIRHLNGTSAVDRWLFPRIQNETLSRASPLAVRFDVAFSLARPDDDSRKEDSIDDGCARSRVSRKL